ncbi:MAG: hypothetical protein QXL01_01565 [Thermoplasmatales archaeon]
MKVRNVIQEIKVGAMVLMPSAGKITPDILKKIREYASAEEADKAQKKEELMASYSKDIRKDLSDLGCDTPLDIIPISLSLSSFLFDIYMSGVSVPSAPLARKIFEKETLDLAEKLKGPDEFDFSDKLQEVVKEVMMDDKKWENAKIHIEASTVNGKITIPLIHKAANMFPEVLEAATKLFMELESGKANEKADS